jgi:hypothetical protein
VAVNIQSPLQSTFRALAALMSPAAPSPPLGFCELLLQADSDSTAPKIRMTTSSLVIILQAYILALGGVGPSRAAGAFWLRSLWAARL